jgi:hypothetical protein
MAGRFSPTTTQAIRPSHPAKGNANYRTQHHGDHKSDGHPNQCLAQIDQQIACSRGRPHLLGDEDWRRKQAMGEHHRQHLPEQQQQWQ